MNDVSGDAFSVNYSRALNTQYWGSSGDSKYPSRAHSDHTAVDITGSAKPEA